MKGFERPIALQDLVKKRSRRSFSFTCEEAKKSVKGVYNYKKKFFLKVKIESFEEKKQASFQEIYNTEIN